MVVGKRRITAMGMLRILSDIREDFLPLTRRAAYRNFYSPKYRNWAEYFPSVVHQVAKRLERKGLVKLVETADGVRVLITEEGKTETLLFKLRELTVKSGKWDKMWRMVFFDVAEVDRRKRDKLRKYLKQLGLKQMQESVWVSPWEIEKEVRYLREVLDVPHAVKLGLLKEIENEEDLKDWFDLG